MAGSGWASLSLATRPWAGPAIVLLAVVETLGPAPDIGPVPRGVPEVYQALSTRRVIVMEEIDGVTVANHAEVEAAPVTARVLAMRLLHSFLYQVLRDGMYHADPHPDAVVLVVAVVYTREQGGKSGPFVREVGGPPAVT